MRTIFLLCAFVVCSTLGQVYAPGLPAPTNQFHFISNATHVYTSPTMNFTLLTTHEHYQDFYHSGYPDFLRDIRTNNAAGPIAAAATDTLIRFDYSWTAVVDQLAGTCEMTPGSTPPQPRPYTFVQMPGQVDWNGFYNLDWYQAYPSPTEVHTAYYYAWSNEPVGDVYNFTDGSFSQISTSVVSTYDTWYWGSAPNPDSSCLSTSDCPSAVPITSYPFVYDGLTAGRSTVWQDCTNWWYAGIWFMMWGDGHTYQISTCDPETNFDTQIAVEGSCSGSGGSTCIAYNNNYCGTGSEIQLDTNIGTQYWIFVFGSSTGQFKLSVQLSYGASSMPGCVPSTCIDYSYECGSTDDGCGNTISCGSCTGAGVCIDNMCLYDGDGTTCQTSHSVWTFPYSLTQNALYSGTTTYCSGGTTKRRGVWLRVIGDGTGLQVATCSDTTTFDTRIYMDDTCVYDAWCLSTGSYDWSCPSYTRATIAWTSVPAADYLVFVTGEYTTTVVGDVNISVTSFCGNGILDTSYGEECEIGGNGCDSYCHCIPPAFADSPVQFDCGYNCDVSCLSCNHQVPECLHCPTGYGINGTAGVDNCTDCRPDQYSNGWESCIPCDGCTTCDPVTAFCSACLPNYYLNTLWGTCTHCATGQWSFGGNETQCIDCPRGCEACVSNITCLKCQAGKGLNTGVCSNCTAMTWSNGSVPCGACDSTGGCLACSPADGTCQSCPVGSGANFTHGCAPCSPGWYQPTNGAPSCINCALGFGCTECDRNTGDCTKCPAGSEISGTRCVVCTGNTYSTDGNDCLTCQMTGGCEECSSQTGKCTQCPATKGLSDVGCASCTAAQYSDGSTVCETCLKTGGCTACSQVDGSCTLCPPGSGLFGTGCITCPEGFYSSGQVECAECDLDNGCLSCSSTSGDCTLCPEGMEISGKGCTGTTSGYVSISVPASASSLSPIFFLTSFLALLLLLVL